jgi:DNA-binding MarR family transcriptional regulator
MATRKAMPVTVAIKQSRPFRSKAHEAVVALLRTANDVTRRLDAITLREGISGQQYNILRILRGAGELLPTMEISDRLVERTPGITGLLDRLESKGLIHRERCREDRRRILCGVTPAGLAILDRLEGAVSGFDDASMGTLSTEEQARLAALLDRIRGSLGEEEPRADGEE